MRFEVCVYPLHGDPSCVFDCQGAPTLVDRHPLCLSPPKKQVQVSGAQPFREGGFPPPGGSPVVWGPAWPALGML